MSISSRIWGYAGQLLTATALTSLSFHLLFTRRDAAAQRARYTARMSILESLIFRLKAGERIDDSEIERLTALERKLQGDETDDLGDFGHQVEEGISWRDVFLGAKKKVGRDMSSEDMAKQEWNEVDTETKRAVQASNLA